ncbi:MAG TPA: glycosyltransferase family 2 protein [Burkholderiales bacterium]|nr:glycosyltransferase family 2 protein [Burkholderiales bacterium]
MTASATPIGLLSVVVPAYNEEAVLPQFHSRLSAVLAKISAPAEVIYVNDGSSDGTLDALNQLKKNDERMAIVDLSRNFGKEIALTAGLDHASGDAVVVIDADLQDPPELIPEFIRYYHEGCDVVYAQRVVREGESALKKATAYAFYRLMQRMSKVKIPEDTGDFRLLSRRAVNSLRRLREQHRFMKGLFAWIGYPQKAVPYQREPRAAGESKWNYWRLWNFALEGITSFSTAPLKFATYIGLVTSLAAFVFAAVIIYKTLAFGEPVRGYPSLMVVILFLGGVQLFTIGIIGEYLGRMFNETKRRPLYIVKDYSPAGTSTTRPDPLFQ